MYKIYIYLLVNLVDFRNVFSVRSKLSWVKEVKHNLAIWTLRLLLKAKLLSSKIFRKQKTNHNNDYGITAPSKVVATVCKRDQPEPILGPDTCWKLIPTCLLHKGWNFSEAHLYKCEKLYKIQNIFLNQGSDCPKPFPEFLSSYLHRTTDNSFSKSINIYTC